MLAGVADRELLAACRDRLAQLVEQDLEARQTLIEEVLGLELEPTGVALGGLDDLAGTRLGGAHHLGALHHPLGLHPGRLEHLVRPRGGSC